MTINGYYGNCDRCPAKDCEVLKTVVVDREMFVCLPCAGMTRQEDFLAQKISNDRGTR